MLCFFSEGRHLFLPLSPLSLPDSSHTDWRVLPCSCAQSIIHLALLKRQAKQTDFLLFLLFYSTFVLYSQKAMSNGVTSNASIITVKAPDLGSFPLDHYRECKSEIEKYYTCLKENEYVSPMCRDQVRDYLQCRMDRGLMKKTEVSSFGIPETEFVPTKQHRIDLREQWLRQKMNQVSVVGVENYVRDDLQTPDGYEKEKGK